MSYIENEKVIRKYWQIRYSYDNFMFDDGILIDEEFSSLNDCYNSYKECVSLNNDMMKAIDEPKAYHLLCLFEETDSTIWESWYKVVHHKNGKVSLRRVY